jgi:uncharacterized protein (TIGR02145 family)
MHWPRPDTGATTETGFTALSGCSHNSMDQSLPLESPPNWWSATNASEALVRRMNFDSVDVTRTLIAPKTVGLSVRCVRD